MPYSTVIINNTQLVENIKSFPTQNICAMVKANAYGVGLENICKVLKPYVKSFGVATLEEALEIRKFNFDTPILIVGMCEDFETASKNNISITIENEEQIKHIIDQNIPIKFHLKINTGMNRFGIKNKKILKKILNLIKKNKNLIFEGIFSHFYYLKNKKISFNQLNIFNNYLKYVLKKYNPIIHIGGSEVFDCFPKKDYQNYMVRVGIKLYENIITIKSKIIKIFEIKKGENVGYSNVFVATKKMKVGIVPLGYADGINRKLGNNAYVKIQNQSCKIIGNICMDVFFVDLSTVDCSVGDEVIVLDNPNYWANICGTINYEILTALNFKRMQIEYI